MNPLVQATGWTLLHFIWQGAGIALATTLLLEVFAFRSARARYAVSCLSLVTMLLAPAVTFGVVSSASVPAIVPFEHRDPSASGPLGGTERFGAEPLSSIDGEQASWIVHPSADSVLAPLVGTWLIGVFLLLGRLAGGLWRVRRLHRRVLASAASSWQRTCERLAERMGIGRAVQVVESALVDAPTVVGWLRPVIVLPIAVLGGLAPAQVEAVLVHELAHIRRHDYIVNLFQTLAETLLFYHPAVWWISARVRTEREYCCDDAAVALSGDALGYATALAELEASRGAAGRLEMAASGGSLLDRIGRILHAPRNDSSRSPGWIATLALTVFFTAGAGGVQWLPSRIAAPRGRTAVAQQLPNTPTRAASAAQVLPMPGDGDTIHLRLQDARYRFRWTDGVSFREVKGYGDVLFADDLTDVRALAAGGYLVFREWTSVLPRSIEIRFNGRELTRKYYVAGFERAWGSEPQQWLSDRLPSLVRRSGLAAGSRTRQILAARGVDGVLDEIGRLESDYARRLYFRELTRAVQPLDQKTTVRALALAGQSIDSDYDLAETLREFALLAAADSTAAKAYVDAADTLRSDYEHRRALVAFLRTDRTTPAAADLAMRSAATIRSDHERAETIGAALKEGLFGQGDAMFAAIAGLRSDYEKRRVLAALVVERPASPEPSKGLLNAAATIDSDFECATLLLSFIEHHDVDPTTSEPFFGAVKTIRSSFERKRVLAGLVSGDAIGREVIQSVLDAAATMSSDFDRAEVLLRLVKHQVLDSTTREALIDVVDGMHSDYEQGRVLVAMVRSERR